PANIYFHERLCRACFRQRALAALPPGSTVEIRNRDIAGLSCAHGSHGSGTVLSRDRRVAAENPIGGAGLLLHRDRCGDLDLWLPAECWPAGFELGLGVAGDG